MAQKFKQVRFYNLSAPNNEPRYSLANDVIAAWGDGTLFDKYAPIVKLGISAPPGTRFTINNSDTEAIINYTGLFELDFTDGSGVISLSFNKTSLNYIINNPSAWIIVDMVYEGGGDT